MGKPRQVAASVLGQERGGEEEEAAFLAPQLDMLAQQRAAVPWGQPALPTRASTRCALQGARPGSHMTKAGRGRSPYTGLH